MVRPTAHERLNIKELHDAVNFRQDVLKLRQLSEYHFRIYYRPKDSPYQYRADYWPRTGSYVLLDQGPEFVGGRLGTRFGTIDGKRGTKAAYASHARVVIAELLGAETQP